jgi:hypothetical protein
LDWGQLLYFQYNAQLGEQYLPLELVQEDYFHQQEVEV